MTFLDRWLIIGGFGMLGGLICWLALRVHRVIVERAQAELRSELWAELQSELQSKLREHRADCSEQIAELGCSVAVLELRAQNIDEAGKGGLTRSLRSQAMQLLRSGVSPENAAATLGTGRREMRLIATVSRTLSPVK